MRRPWGVFVNGLLMNRFITQGAAHRLVVNYASKGILAQIKVIGDVLEAV